jgi:hypothetical protein
MYGGGRAGGAGYGGGYGGSMGRNYRTMTDADRRILDKLCEDRARGIRIYASPVDLDGYVFWTDWKFENKNKSMRQSWYWQMGYWILEDVVDTIVAMNQRGSSVLDGPVKRLMGVTLAQGRQTARMIGGRRGRAVRRDGTQLPTPSYAINLKSAMAAPPCTGRFSNEENADVMHFEVRVLIGADQVMPFIQELCSAKTHAFRGWDGKDPEQTFKHNQITVLEQSIIPVDLEDNMHAVYRYGPGAVVELDLICEYVFPKSAQPKEGDPNGLADMMPSVVKDDIAGVAPKDGEGTTK